MKQETTLIEGQYFQGDIYELDGSKYILTGFYLNGHEYSILVHMSSGNRWNDPVKVKDFTELTNKEFDSVCNFKNFNLVERFQK